MEGEKILDNITKSITERLKVPIIATYVCVLFIYNWDILFYLFFESVSASNKIQFIKNEYGDVYFKRIFICLLFSVALIVLFTILNTLINFCLKWFYRKDKEITSEIEDYEKVKLLTEQLSKSIDDIKKLNSEIENISNINNNLSNNIKPSISDISKKDYNKLMSSLKSNENSEKLIYSLKELTEIFKKNSNAQEKEFLKSATYEAEMKELINHLIIQNLIKLKTDFIFSDNSMKEIKTFELSRSFKDILKMEI